MNDQPQNVIFEVLDSVPGQVWYTAAILSIVTSAYFQITGKRHWALFVGQWAPTFLAVGLYHKLVRPSTERIKSTTSRHDSINKAAVVLTTFLNVYIFDHP